MLAHELGMAALELASESPPLLALMNAVYGRKEYDPFTFAGLHFANRIGLAAGLDKNARAVPALTAMGFGFLELGTVTAHAQAANPSPNMFRLPRDRALINRMGFPNAGAEALAARIRSAAREVPIGISIGKSRVVDANDLEAVAADYAASMHAVCMHGDFLVINVSSPNTAGLRALQHAEAARAVFDAVMRANTAACPVLVKLAPDLSDADAEASLKVAMSAGLSGAVCSNTTLHRGGLNTPAEDVARMGAGGLSGPVLFARTAARVSLARRVLGGDKLLIGVGGVSTPEHVVQLREAGADLIQVYTALVYNGPGVVTQLAHASTLSPSL